MALSTRDIGSDRLGGLFGSVKGLTATLLGIAHTRLELFSTELEEEGIRLVSIVRWALVALFCAVLGVIFGTLFVVFALWNTHPLLALGIPAALFFLVGVLAWRVVDGKVKSKPRLFAASLAELDKDREKLISRS
jgi:uncharacterized membrane protein YqjE